MTTSMDIAGLNNRLKGGQPITLLDVRCKAEAGERFEEILPTIP